MYPNTGGLSDTPNMLPPLRLLTCAIARRTVLQESAALLVLRSSASALSTLVDDVSTAAEVHGFPSVNEWRSPSPEHEEADESHFSPASSPARQLVNFGAASLWISDPSSIVLPELLVCDHCDVYGAGEFCVYLTVLSDALVV